LIFNFFKVAENIVNRILNFSIRAFIRINYLVSK